MRIGKSRSGNIKTFNVPRVVSLFFFVITQDELYDAHSCLVYMVEIEVPHPEVLYLVIK